MLTDAKIKNATVQGKKIRKLSDAQGLYLWVFEDGKKYWRLRYYIDGKEKSLSLGTYPDVSLKEAREKRDVERALLKKKIDPASARKVEKLQAKLDHENAFQAVALEWQEKQKNHLSHDHAESIKRRLEVDIFPEIGPRPINEIKAPELLLALRKIEKRGAHDLASRILQICGRIFRYGVATGRCETDVAAFLKGALTPHKAKNQNAVKPEQLPKLFQDIASYDETGDRQTRLALQLLTLTFVRTNELIGATWSELDLDAAMWSIPAERMKMDAEHLVPLSRQSLAILEQLKTLAGESKFILPGRNRDTTISNNTMLFALYRLGYKGRMSGHGFRSVASTCLNELDYKADVIERQLAHCERNAVRGAYNRAEYMPERKELMQDWGNIVDELTSGVKWSTIVEEAHAKK